jgi:hypothetical protein
MGKSAVREILNQIEKLPEPDRALLESELAQRAEAQWQREAAAARKLARQRRIDQDAIDRAVEQDRYPTRRASR